MRPYEYYQRYWARHIEERISATKPVLGLLCSFQEEKPWKMRGAIRYNIPLIKKHIDIGSISHNSDTKWRYSFSEFKRQTENFAKQINWEFKYVGKKQNALDWMDEVMHVILLSDLVVVDVSQPRQNVIYELAIANSLRANENIIITQHISRKLEGTEPLQLQFLKYDSYTDLFGKLKQHIIQSNDLLGVELGFQFEVLKNKISPVPMSLLQTLLNLHLERYKKEKINAWNRALDQSDPKFEEFRRDVSELQDLGLVRYNYGLSKNAKGFEWSVYPTLLGVRFMQSDNFLKILYDSDELVKIKSQLTKIEQSGRK